MRFSINQALVKQHTGFSGRLQIQLIQEITKGGGIGSLDYGPFWKSQRKFGLITFRGYVYINAYIPYNLCL